MLTYDIPTEELRQMVRVSSSSLDDELESLKEAFLHELDLAGVRQIPTGDHLAAAALRLYLRYQLNLNGDGDRYWRMYSLTRDAMALSHDYGEEG